MTNDLTPDVTHSLTFSVPVTKTVPHLFPESPEFQLMPETLATGFLVGLVEWACIEAVNSRIDWPREQTLGTHIDITHEAATPAGLQVTIDVRLVKVDGPKVLFSFEAHDNFDRVARGTHERHIIDAQRFGTRLNAKSEQARGS